jgi:hypothetical protein
MGIRTLAYRIGLFALLREIDFTLAQMREEPLAAPYVPVFEALRAKWTTILLQEIDILGALTGAHAAVVKADGDIDAFAGRTSRAIDDKTAGNTRKQLRIALFKGKSLSKFRGPVLGRELTDMTDWSATLTGCGVPALASLATEADTLVDTGHKASAQRDTAHQTNRNFRDVGARKQFIDEVNAARQDAAGGLGKLPFQNATLPQDFAEGFFLRDAPRDEEETIDEVKASITELTEQLGERQTLLTKLEADAAAAAKAEAERKAEEQQAEALEEQAQALLAQAAALKAKAKK